MELQITPKKRLAFHDNGVQFAWDATSISAAQTCLRYYQYSIVEGWRSNKENEHLLFGGTFATALEHYYLRVAGGEDWLDALEAVVEEALLSTWYHERTADGERIPGTGKPWVSTHSSKNRENLIRTIVWYIDSFHDEEEVKVFMLADGTPAVEHTFQLPVDNGIVFTGHIDRVVEYADNPYVMDQKTTEHTITPNWFNQFKPHTQFSMYTFAGKAVFGIPVKGVIIDGAQIAVGFSRFERSVSLRTDDELNEFYDDSMYWIARAQHAVLDNHFPMNPSACGNYGGCRYRGVCARTPGLRENFLKADFNQRDPWDPLTVR